MKSVLLLISESFPYGKAYASRSRAIVKMLEYAGFDVTIVCDRINGNEFCNEKYKVIEVFPKEVVGVKKLWVVPHIYCKTVDFLLRNNKFDCVIARSMFDRHDLLLKTVKKYKLPFVLESCECYDPKSFNRGRYDIRYFQFIHCWKKSYNSVDAVIAISRYLENHYLSKNIPVMRLPAILDTRCVSFDKRDIHTNPIRLIYGGDITGGKEIFDEIITAIRNINSENCEITFDIFGPSITDISIVVSKINYDYILNNNNNIVVHGRVPQNEMNDYLQASDYGIFIRPDRLSSNAGFPTKLGEYLASGKPVITNRTGDIELVLNDNVNGFFVEGTSADAIECTLRRVLKMKADDVIKMKEEARYSAEQLLDPIDYKDNIKIFIESLL